MTEPLFQVSREERTMYQATYTRAEVVDILANDGGRESERDLIEKLSDAALLALLLDDANQGMDVNDRLVTNSEKSWIVDWDDWAGTVITIEQQRAEKAETRKMINL